MNPATHIRQLLESIERIDEATLTPEKVTKALHQSKSEVEPAAKLLGIPTDRLIQWLNLHTDKLGKESRRWIEHSDGDINWKKNGKNIEMVMNQPLSIQKGPNHGGLMAHFIGEMASQPEFVQTVKRNTGFMELNKTHQKITKNKHRS